MTANLPAEQKLGYCNGVGSDGMMCFVRRHCMHHMHPALDKRTIFAPFTWRLADHNKWQMECPEYVGESVGYDANDSPVVDAKACPEENGCMYPDKCPAGCRRDWKSVTRRGES